MEVPVDVSDGEEELQDFDDIGDDDWEEGLGFRVSGSGFRLLGWG